MLHFLRTNSIRAGIIGGMLLSALAAAFIAFDGSSADARAFTSTGTPSVAATTVTPAQAPAATPAASTRSSFSNPGGSQQAVAAPAPAAAPARTAAPASTAPAVPAKCMTIDKTICVVKTGGSHATMFIIQNKKVLKQLPVRTGDARGPEYVTTNGTWYVGWKDIDHKSSEYDNAPMPYSLFFHGGEAIHYSYDFDVNDYGGMGSSAGCVNVGSMADAAWIYDWAPVGTRVVVTG